MPWLQSARRTRAVAAVASAWLVWAAWGAAPAVAHGALASPVSRAVACGPEGGAAAASAACQAAAAVSGGAGAFGAWDDIRVPDVGGRDRQRIPDGKLCSGGLTQFRGLDLVRADWPTTTLRSGASFTFRYRVTIPHRGSFRLYLTRSGYPSTHPLRWADLQAKPFLTVANPTIRNGAYVIPGRLPAGRTGRDLIYTIWQTTDTPDTYYSCSDVVFQAAAGAAPQGPNGAAVSPAVGGAGAGQGMPLASGAPAGVETRPAASVTRFTALMPVLLALGAGLAGAAVLIYVRHRRADPARRAAARARERGRQHLMPPI